MAKTEHPQLATLDEPSPKSRPLITSGAACATSFRLLSCVARKTTRGEIKFSAFEFATPFNQHLFHHCPQLDRITVSSAQDLQRPQVITTGTQEAVGAG